MAASTMPANTVEVIKPKTANARRTYDMQFQHIRLERVEARRFCDFYDLRDAACRATTPGLRMGTIAPADPGAACWKCASISVRTYSTKLCIWRFISSIRSRIC